jgi:hypothetical protein
VQEAGVRAFPVRADHRQSTCGSPATTGLRPGFCPAADPEPERIAENLAGYAKAGLMVPQALFDDLAAANAAAPPKSAARA